MVKTQDNASYETDYKIGQDNVTVLGCDIHNPVFFMSAGLVLLFSVTTLLFPVTANSWLTDTQNWTLQTFDWLFAVTPIFALVFCTGIALTPLGKIRLGGAGCRPEFGTASWIAMLFSAGVGIGYLFYGAAEPLAYYTNWAGTPYDIEPGTERAHRLAMSASIFHWGILGWAVYAVVGLALGFFAFNKGLPLTIRSAFYPIFGDRIWGWPGHLIDLFTVIATIFGLATSIGLGATQATSGFGYLFDFSPTLAFQIGLIVVISAAALLSVLRGLNGGIKVLSNLNMLLALVLLVFVFAGGDRSFLASSLGQNLITYFQDSPLLSNWVNRTDTDFFHGWTIFYWAWWVAWAPFVGMFIARISKGRSVREFLLLVLTAPTIIGIIWFSVFGETAIMQYQDGVGDIAAGVSDSSLVLFHLLDNLPYATITSLIGIVLLIVFITTSADSGAVVIDTITAGGKVDTPVLQRVFWTIMLGLTASALLFGGGAEALQSLRAGTIIAALPSVLILLACCVGLYLGLLDEYRSVKKEPGTDQISTGSG